MTSVGDTIAAVACSFFVVPTRVTSRLRGTVLSVALSQLACTREATPPPDPPPDPPVTTPPPIVPSTVPPSIPTAAPAVVGCWEREFGSAPAKASMGPSLPGLVPGCDGCETLRVGPNAAGLHVQVLRRIHAMIAGLPPSPIDEPVLWVNSGARVGDPDTSMHNQALAIDAVICGLDTRATAQRLRSAGFTCVIEYYDRAGNPCHFAHGDLRATVWAQGAYAKGGRKARTCPKRAESRTMNCDNSSKRDWTYSEG